MVREKLANVADAIRDDNRWLPLLRDIDTDQSLNNYTDEFIDVSKQIAVDCGVIETVRNIKPKSWRLTRKSIKALGMKRAALKDFHAARGEEKDAKWEAYKVARKQCKKVLQMESGSSWEKFLAKGSELASNGNHKHYWKWVKPLVGNVGSKVSQIRPIKNPQGLIEVKKEGIKKTWQNYYHELFRDATGHSKNEVHWQNMLDESTPELDGINDELTTLEIVSTIKYLGNNKAPGIDELPAEWYKVLLGKDGSLMQTVVVNLCSSIWSRGKVPEAINKAVIVNIPKKGGNVEDCNDYRGISLISVALKIVARIVAARLAKVCDKNNILTEFQAGFRRKEECMGQVIALAEITMRRQQKGMSTAVTFLDFQKAYDSVPHQALFCKLRKYGVKGKCLQFIQSLYEESWGCVRVGMENTDSVKINRGLRQGCPLSPILFNLFINDLLDDLEGVSVPGMVGKIPGLLFADDAGAMGEDREALQRNLNKVSAWADKWEMTFGIKKCGTMIFYGEQIDQALDLQGGKVPNVKEYKYLGVLVTPTWDLEAMINARAENGKRVLNMIKKLLVVRRLSLKGKLHLIRSLLIPVLNYGGELWGSMGTKCIDQLDKILKEAVALVISGSGKGTIRRNYKLVLHHLGLVPISMSAAKKSLRAWKKYPGLATVVSRLIQSSASSGKKTWSQRTGMLCKSLFGKNSWSLRAVLPALWEKFSSRSARQNQTMRAFRANGLQGTRSILFKRKTKPEHGAALCWLIKARCGLNWTALSAAQAKRIAPEWRSKCPSCLEMVRPDEAHYLLSCKAFDTARTAHLQPVLGELQPMMSLANDQSELFSILLGGKTFAGPGTSAWLEAGPLVQLNTGEWIEKKIKKPKETPVLEGILKFLRATLWKFNRDLWD
jgi:hypothetical protein